MHALHHQWGSYAAGTEGAGLCGVPDVGVSVGVGAVGEGWKLGGIGEVEDRRGSLGATGGSAPPLLESALTFCNSYKQRNTGLGSLTLNSTRISQKQDFLQCSKDIYNLINYCWIVPFDPLWFEQSVSLWSSTKLQDC